MAERDLKNDPPVSLDYRSAEADQGARADRWRRRTDRVCDAFAHIATPVAMVAVCGALGMYVGPHFRAFESLLVVPIFIGGVWYVMLRLERERASVLTFFRGFLAIGALIYWSIMLVSAKHGYLLHILRYHGWRGSYLGDDGRVMLAIGFAMLALYGLLDLVCLLRWIKSRRVGKIENF